MSIATRKAVAAEARQRLREARKAAKARLAGAKAKLLAREKRARQLRDHYHRLAQALRQRRLALPNAIAWTARAVVAAERLVRESLAEVERERRRWELSYPKAAQAAKRSGRRLQERRAEWYWQAFGQLDEHDRELAEALARTHRIHRGQNKGKTWLQALTPNEAREHFEEWLQDNPGAREEADYQRAEAREISDQIAQMKWEYERAGLQFTEEMEREEMKRLKKKKASKRSTKPAAKRATPTKRAAAPAARRKKTAKKPATKVTKKVAKKATEKPAAKKVAKKPAAKKASTKVPPITAPRVPSAGEVLASLDLDRAYRIRDLRAKFPGTHAEFDGILHYLHEQNSVALYTENNGQNLSEAEHKAALIVGHEPRHILYRKR